MKAQGSVGGEGFSKTPPEYLMKKQIFYLHGSVCVRCLKRCLSFCSFSFAPLNLVGLTPRWKGMLLIQQCELVHQKQPPLKCEGHWKVLKVTGNFRVKIQNSKPPKTLATAWIYTGIYFQWRIMKLTRSIVKLAIEKSSSDERVETVDRNVISL